jgi:hypothetical protein
VTSQGKALMYAIRDELTKRYGPFWGHSLPAGLRLEMHPSTVNLLYQDSELWEHGYTETIDTLILRAFSVPLKITLDVEEDHWRLVIVTENVLLGGRLKEGDARGPDKPDAQPAGGA